MEYINAVNIITAVIVLLILYFLKKLFTADIGENRFFYILALVALCVGVYLWRSGVLSEVIGNIFGVVE
ncbi:hypothetical protein ACFL1N_01320 [Thermodesulfobacteriota bacterium]